MFCIFQWRMKWRIERLKHDNKAVFIQIFPMENRVLGEALITKDKKVKKTKNISWFY